MSFEFLREGYVLFEINEGGTLNKYRLHTTREVSFSQSFKQEEVRKKNLYNLNQVIDGSSIVEANPANFSFTIFLLDEGVKYQHNVLDSLILSSSNYTRFLSPFNLYFVYPDYNPIIYYKVENCILTSGNFIIPRRGIIRLGLEGQGTKLTRNTGDPGSFVAGYSASPTFGVSKELDVWVGGSTLSDKLDNVLGVNFEIQNNIEWIKNKTLQASLNVTNQTNTIFPQDYVLKNRSVAGTIQQYINQSIVQSTNKVLTWAENTTVHIKAGLSSADYQIELTMDNNASFTNRSNTGEVFTQNYDFRLMDTPAAWSSVFSY